MQGDKKAVWAHDKEAMGRTGWGAEEVGRRFERVKSCGKDERIRVLGGQGDWRYFSDRNRRKERDQERENQKSINRERRRAH